MRTGMKRFLAGMAAIASLATTAPLLSSTPAAAASASPPASINGPVTMSPTSGTTASTSFNLSLPAGAACPGDTFTTNHLWQTFMVDASVDLQTINFSATGPVLTEGADTGKFAKALFRPVGTKVVNMATDVGSASSGPISGIPTLSFASAAPIPDGSYKIGIACTLAGSGTSQLKSYWMRQVTVSGSGANWSQGGTVSGAPTITSITPGDSSFSINFTAPGSPDPAISTYQYSTDDGATWNNRASGATASPLEVTGVANGVAYQVRIRAVNSLGAGVQSGATPVTALTSFTSVTPARVFDTRPDAPNGLRVVPKVKISGATELKVKLTDLTGLVPSSGVGSVSLNVTVTEAGAPGFVTVYPCGTRPNASSLNYVTGQTVPNAVIAPVSGAGEVCFFSNAPVHLLADVNGWFASGSSFTAVTPSRVFDTRADAPNGLRVVPKVKISGATELKVKLTDLTGLVPSSGVGAVSLNVTVTEAGGSGFVTVYPCGTRPNASSLNYVTGQTVPNAVIAPVSGAGEVCFFSNAPVHLLADVNGWFASGSSFTSVSPSRVFDTRADAPNGLRVVPKVKISGATELKVKLTDLTGLVPSSGVGAVSLNVTVTEAGGSGFVTVYPCGTRPNASSLNYVTGETVPNAVIAPVSGAGEVCFFSNAPVHLLADVNGWFASSAPVG